MVKMVSISKIQQAKSISRTIHITRPENEKPIKSVLWVFRISGLNYGNSKAVSWNQKFSFVLKDAKGTEIETVTNDKAETLSSKLLNSLRIKWELTNTQSKK